MSGSTLADDQATPQTGHAERSTDTNAARPPASIRPTGYAGLTDGGFCLYTRTAIELASHKNLLGSISPGGLVDFGGRTPLHVAALYGPARLVEDLLAMGWDPTSTDSDLVTPLHYAGMGGQLACGQALLAAGADITAWDVFDRSPIDYALRTGQTEWALAMLEHLGPLAGSHHGHYALCAAASAGNLGAVRVLLLEGISPDALDPFATPALICSVRGNDPRVFEALCQAGADPDARDVLGLAAAHHLAARMDPRWDAAAERAGLSMDVLDPKGTPARAYAHLARVEVFSRRPNQFAGEDRSWFSRAPGDLRLGDRAPQAPDRSAELPSSAHVAQGELFAPYVYLEPDRLVEYVEFRGWVQVADVPAERVQIELCLHQGRCADGWTYPVIRRCRPRDVNTTAPEASDWSAFRNLLCLEELATGTYQISLLVRAEENCWRIDTPHQVVVDTPEDNAGHLAEEKLVFVHVPKTAGSSFQAYLINAFGDRYRGVNYNDYALDGRLDQSWLVSLDQLALQDSLVPKYAKVIHGHISAATINRVLPNKRFLVWFRDPIQRLYSDYYHNSRHKMPYPLQHYRLHGTNLDHDRTLGGEVSMQQWVRDFRRNIHAHYLGDLPIEQIDFVGITEQFDRSIQLFEAMFGLGEIDAGQPVNVNPAKKVRKGYDVPEDVVALARQHHGRDLDLYNQAVRRFEQLCAEYGL